MNWILPMAGRGSRTSELGSFKPFIKIDGRPILEWLLLSISAHFRLESRIVMVTTAEFEKLYSVRDTVAEIFARLGLHLSCEIILAEDTPPGPAASTLLARPALARLEHEPICVVNIDQYIHFEIPSNFTAGDVDGFLPAYLNLGTKSSYLRVEGSQISEIREKDPISPIASAGVYALRKASLLFDAIEEAMQGKPHVRDEYYVGPTLNLLIAKGVRLIPGRVLAKYDLGSIDGINNFRQHLTRQLLLLESCQSISQS